jgi:hypothetical protein
MAGVSIDEVWDDARGFFMRERALVLPIGFATFGLAALLGGLVVPAPEPPAKEVVLAPWMFVLIPTLLLNLTGHLSLARIALRPRISVAEALRDALRLLPRAIALFLVLVVTMLGLSLVAAVLVSLLSVFAGLTDRTIAALAVAIVIPPALVVCVRVVTLAWLTLADQEGTIRQTLERTVALTRGHAVKILGVLIAYTLLFLLLVVVLESAVGVVFVLLTRMAGLPALGPLLVTVLLAAFNAIYMSFWTIFLACLYVRLAWPQGRG